jgi:hypothetical protein
MHAANHNHQVENMIERHSNRMQDRIKHSSCININKLTINCIAVVTAVVEALVFFFY